MVTKPPASQTRHFLYRRLRKELGRCGASLASPGSKLQVRFDSRNRKVIGTDEEKDGSRDFG